MAPSGLYHTELHEECQVAPSGAHQTVHAATEVFNLAAGLAVADPLKSDLLKVPKGAVPLRLTISAQGAITGANLDLHHRSGDAAATKLHDFVGADDRTADQSAVVYEFERAARVGPNPTKGAPRLGVANDTYYELHASTAGAIAAGQVVVTLEFVGL